MTTDADAYRAALRDIGKELHELAQRIEGVANVASGAADDKGEERYG